MLLRLLTQYYHNPFTDNTAHTVLPVGVEMVLPRKRYYQSQNVRYYRSLGDGRLKWGSGRGDLTVSLSSPTSQHAPKTAASSPSTAAALPPSIHCSPSRSGPASVFLTLISSDGPRYLSHILLLLS